MTYFFTPRYDGMLLEVKEQIENDKSNDLSSNLSSAGLSSMSLNALNDDATQDDAWIDEETWLLNHSSYIPLEHRCLRPGLEDLRLLVEENDQYYNSYHQNYPNGAPGTVLTGGYQSVYDEDQGSVVYERKKRKDGYEMLEIIQSTDNYAMDDL